MMIPQFAGFIGSNFVHHRLGRYPRERLVVLDALTYAGNLANLKPVKDHPALRVEQGNICDTSLVERLLRKEAIDTVVHFAAESHVDRSIHGPDAFIETNVQGTHSLLKAARNVWLQDKAVTRHRFHHVSTDEVYGSLGPDDPPFHEGTPYAPNSPYSATKAASDHLVRAYHRTYGLEVTTSNCSNNYGPFQFPEKLIPLLILNLLHGRPLPIYGDGRNVRDWLHVSDHCAGIDLILARGVPGAVYNIGGGSECENLELVRLLCAGADKVFKDRSSLKARYPQCPAARGVPTESLIRFVEDRPGHDRRYAIDSSKIEHELGYRAQRSLEQGLRDTLEWYLENEAWWKVVTGSQYERWIRAQYRA